MNNNEKERGGMKMWETTTTTTKQQKQENHNAPTDQRVIKANEVVLMNIQQQSLCYNLLSDALFMELN